MRVERERIANVLMCYSTTRVDDFKDHFESEEDGERVLDLCDRLDLVRYDDFLSRVVIMYNDEGEIRQILQRSIQYEISDYDE